MGGQRFREWSGDARRRAPHAGRNAVHSGLRKLTQFRPRLLVLALIFGALAGATACGGVPTEVDDGQGPVLAGGAAAAERDPEILGQWFRRAVATDGLGSVFSIQTIWTFQDDGTVQRRLVTFDMFSDVADEIVATGKWTTATANSGVAGTVTIQFLAPTPTVLRLSYQIGIDAQGTVLILDGIPYRRASR